MTDSAASTSATIKPIITWHEIKPHNCLNCTQMATRIEDPSKVTWIDMVDPRFSDFHCRDCCIRCAHDFDPSVMNASAYLQQLKLRRLVERFGFPYEWNESYKNIWFPEDQDGTVWRAYLGDHYADGTMIIVRMKMQALDLPEPVIYTDNEDDDDYDIMYDDILDINNPNHIQYAIDVRAGLIPPNTPPPMDDDDDDFVPPPQTPPPMDPVTVCPDAPVKPKEERLIAPVSAFQMWRTCAQTIQGAESGPARIRAHQVNHAEYCDICCNHWTYCSCERWGSEKVKLANHY